MNLHIHRDGQQFGPYTATEFLDYLANGNVVGTDLVWAAEFGEEWRPASEAEPLVREWIGKINQPTTAHKEETSAAPAMSSTNSNANPLFQRLTSIGGGLIGFAVIYYLSTNIFSNFIHGGRYKGSLSICEPIIKVSNCEKNESSMTCTLAYSPSGQFARNAFYGDVYSWGYDKNGVQIGTNWRLDISGLARGASKTTSVFTATVEDWRKIVEIKLCSADPKSTLGQSLEFVNVR